MIEETPNASTANGDVVKLDDTFNVRTTLDIPVWLIKRLDEEAKIYGQSRAAHLRTILIERYGAPKAIIGSEQQAAA